MTQKRFYTRPVKDYGSLFPPSNKKFNKGFLSLNSDRGKVWIVSYKLEILRYKHNCDYLAMECCMDGQNLED